MNERVPRHLQFSDGALLHMYWQCTNHNKQYLFENEDLKELYLELVAKYKKQYDIKLLDFALMGNHQHLLVRISTVAKFSRFLQSLHTSFARRVNNHYGNTGAVVENRVKVSVVEETDEAILSVQRYLALNRWNCEERTLPQDYRFCGYRHYAGLERDDRIDTSEAWLALGDTDEERFAAYGEMVEARRQELGLGPQEPDDLPSFYSGSPDFCRIHTERLLQAFREHNKALTAARALSLTTSDAAASCASLGGRHPCRHHRCSLHPAATVGRHPCRHSDALKKD
ncbi:MAG: hypothetical protein A2284_04300 [Deltaproteobacteria bacterium RIFOXYA12_FULL_61_11]|nr:MAG: hypothetical protein A2284_04300 [Deltaproteobacteria bacterium RIFOXYA12_FULL_61_11]